jgi:GNAT superfamily N-acetyltransferase
MDSKLSPTPSAGYTLRTHRPGDIGWIIHRHATYYDKAHDWGLKMEGLAAKVGADFLENYDESTDRCWIAERNDEFLGSIILVKDRDQVNAAKLRLFLVEPSARGLGLGQALVQQCKRFARECGYAKIHLWTQGVLLPARRLYTKEGFQLVSSEENEVFGVKLMGECWELVF